MSEKLTAVAWVGEDELGSGEVGIKRVLLEGQPMALVLMETQRNVMEKLTDEELMRGLQDMVNHYGKPVRLVRLQVVDELQVLLPQRNA